MCECVYMKIMLQESYAQIYNVMIQAKIIYFYYECIFNNILVHEIGKLHESEFVL